MRISNLENVNKTEKKEKEEANPHVKEGAKYGKEQSRVKQVMNCTERKDDEGNFEAKRY